MKKIILLLILIALPLSVSALPTQQPPGLAFDTVAKADGYNLYWSITSLAVDCKDVVGKCNGKYTDINRIQMQGNSNTYIKYADMIGIPPIGPLYFVVTAYNANGESEEFSNEESRPLVLPLVVGNLRKK